MRKARYILIVLLCFNSFVSWTQANYGIRKICAFYTERLPGNIRVDPNGNSLYKGPDTLITIYIVTSGKSAVWESAWRNDRTYTISSSLVSQTPYTAGTNLGNGKEIILRPATGNKLWQLNLLESYKKVASPRKIKPGEVLLKGKYMNKTIFRKIGSLIQLTTFPSV
jgi:hypothetical protein